MLKKVPKWTIWILAFIFVGALAWGFRIGFFFFAIYVVGGIVLLSGLISFTALAGLVSSRKVSATEARPGERVKVSSVLTNRKYFPVIWGMFEDLLSNRLAIEGTPTQIGMLGPRRQLTLRYDILCDRRGYFQIGPLLVESGDPFGLVRRFRTFTSVQYLTVFPKIVPLPSLGVPGRRPVAETPMRDALFEDPLRIVGIRAYVPGDPLKRVHWKATARTGSLKSKVLEPAALVGATIVIDMDPLAYEELPGEDAVELAVTAGASVIYAVADAGQQFAVLSNGQDAADRVQRQADRSISRSRKKALSAVKMKERSDRLRPVRLDLGRGEVHLAKMLEVLARLELRPGGMSLSEMLNRYFPSLPREATLVIVTPRVKPELLLAMENLSRSGFALTLVHIVSNQGEEEQAPGVTCPYVRLKREEDILALSL